MNVAFKTLLFYQACKPTSDWGPYLKQHRGSRYAEMEDPNGPTVQEVDKDTFDCKDNPTCDNLNEKTEQTKI